MTWRGALQIIHSLAASLEPTKIEGVDPTLISLQHMTSMLTATQEAVNAHSVQSSLIIFLFLGKLCFFKKKKEKNWGHANLVIWGIYEPKPFSAATELQKKNNQKRWIQNIILFIQLHQTI